MSSSAAFLGPFICHTTDFSAQITCQHFHIPRGVTNSHGSEMRNGPEFSQEGLGEFWWLREAGHLCPSPRLYPVVALPLALMRGVHLKRKQRRPVRAGEGADSGLDFSPLANGFSGRNVPRTGAVSRACVTPTAASAQAAGHHPGTCWSSPHTDTHGAAGTQRPGFSW